MIKENFQKLFNKCLAEVSALDISLLDNLRFGRVQQMHKPVYISFYDDRTEITVAEELLKFPIEMIKAEIISQILSIEDRQRKYKEDWQTNAVQVQAAFGQNMLNEFFSINDRRQKYGQKWLDKAAKVQAAMIC